MKSQNLIEMDFCQKQVSAIQLDLPGIEIKNVLKLICHGSFNQNKSFTHLSQILTIRTPYAMCIDIKSAAAGSIRPKIPIHISRRALLSNQAEMQWPLVFCS